MVDEDILCINGVRRSHRGERGGAQQRSPQPKNFIGENSAQSPMTDALRDKGRLTPRSN